VTFPLAASIRQSTSGFSVVWHSLQSPFETGARMSRAWSAVRTVAFASLGNAAPLFTQKLPSTSLRVDVAFPFASTMRISISGAPRLAAVSEETVPAKRKSTAAPPRLWQRRQAGSAGIETLTFLAWCAAAAETGMDELASGVLSTSPLIPEGGGEPLDEGTVPSGGGVHARRAPTMAIFHPWRPSRSFPIASILAARVCDHKKRRCALVFGSSGLYYAWRKKAPEGAALLNRHPWTAWAIAVAVTIKALRLTSLKWRSRPTRSDDARGVVSPRGRRAAQEGTCRSATR